MRALPHRYAGNGRNTHRWTHGKGPSGPKLIDQLTETLKLTSMCGLGQVVPAPIASVIKHFREEIEAHIVSQHAARKAFARPTTLFPRISPRGEDV